ncbi:MAG: hypothetical protein ACI9XP_001146 [Lentimonas sp.]|jgi:hypothetical protein
MNIQEFKTQLKNGLPLTFQLENGGFVPAHYHITEVGVINKNFIDCGGTIREEQKINFQLWFSNDVDHRLTAEKLLKIIEVAEAKIGLPDEEIEVEYQSDTIGKYGIEASEFGFILSNSQTACLAPDACGIPAQKEIVVLESLNNSCTPGGGCC